MSGRLDDLTPKQVATLQQFRDNVKDVLKPEHDDHYLLRWLRARRFDLNKAETMLRNNLTWREQNKVDTILETFTIPEVIKKYYIGGLFGRDKEGSLIWIDPYGYMDLKGMLRSAKKSDIIKSKIHLLETIYKKFDELTQKEGRRVDQLVIIFDLQYMGLKHLWKPGVDVLLEVLAMFEDYYPETLKVSYVINAPRIFPIAYSLVRPILSEDTVRKIHVLGSNYKDTLLKYIDEDQIPAHWGGTYTDPDGDPRAVSHICFGGDIPSSYYCQELTNLENFTETSIGRGSSLQLEYEIKIPRSLIRWQFKTDGFDIGFGIFYRKSSGRQKAGEMEPILASQRVNSHMIPEDGSITCQQEGTYVVRFDNTYSWAHGKKLFYLIEVIAPDVRDLDMTQSSPTKAETQFYFSDQGVSDVKSPDVIS
ncbi:SEC14-like protein 2 [Gigantopelta aegis]|uniref:SEC14-like protein 2 n=1 Tax=Gigantopelta aegis TaxID=1735272 RepID=UPI001B88A386|nr:SEC14-like protein 2 [Gigantopelta aegis]